MLLVKRILGWRARHESVNMRYKHFALLQTASHYRWPLHAFRFHAIVRVTLLALGDEPLFSVILVAG